MYTEPDSERESVVAAEPVILAFARLDRLALGIAVGAVVGAIVCGATLFLIAKGGHDPGRNLNLLGHYFIGYNVSVRGAFVGLVYGFATGFAVGWLVAFLRNFFLSAYLSFVRLDSDLSHVSEVFENPSEGVRKS